jgi:uncharacterized cupin superfamily protein
VCDGQPDRPHSRRHRRPQARSDSDGLYDWYCSAGRFNWHYSEDEILVVVDGEAFITDEHGTERRLGPGDMGFFPAGSSATWRITGHVRKFAMVRSNIPRPLVFLFRAWRRLVRMVRPQVASPMTTLMIGGCFV